MRRRPADIRLENLVFESVNVQAEGIARFEKGKIRVPFALKDEVSDVHLTSRIGDLFSGRMEKIHQKSSLRREPPCAHFGVCGGCQWQHVEYETECSIKQDWVHNLFSSLCSLDGTVVESFLPAADPYFYRNKMEYTFSNRPWIEARGEEKSAYRVERNVVGFHVPGRFDKILPVERCHLQQDPSNAIRDHILQLSQTHGFDHYDNRTFSGFLRNLIIRCTRRGEFMVILSFGKDVPEWSSLVMESLREKFPSITSLYSVLNMKRNPTLLDQPHIHHSGHLDLVEKIGGLDFLVGPKSFFQSNSPQMEKLYECVRDYSELSPGEIAYDLYCGTGTIACMLAKQCGSVVGVEVVAEAIEDAKRNADANGIGNAHFVSGDVKDILDPGFSEQYGKPDVVVVDPPRPGLHEDVIKVLLGLAPRKIVYVSCNPETQERDVRLLSSLYRLAKLRPVDMVPRTRHVENVVQLVKRA